MRKGFTLIELLTVIAIIAVLSAILFPVVSSARGKARQATCMSNLQQLGAAIALYESDTGGFLPSWSVSHPRQSAPPATRDMPADGVITWDLSIMPYLKDKRILMCHSNPTEGLNHSIKAREARAYAITQYTQNFKSVTEPAYGLYKDRIPAPSKTVLLFEKGSNPVGSWGDALGQNVLQSHNSDGQPGYTEATFHYEGKNLLYVDGHVKLEKKGQGEYGPVEIPKRKKAGGHWPDAD
jgi:prepilin-type N-terminal cleavage/methylation domain-containing protein/prepilin-type processing-associated H-X9-DG protein